MANLPAPALFPFLAGRARRCAYAEVTIAAGGGLVVFVNVTRFSPRAMPWTFFYVPTTMTTSTNAWAETTHGTGSPPPARVAVLDYVRGPGDSPNVYSVLIKNRWEDPNANQIPIDVQIFHLEVEP